MRSLSGRKRSPARVILYEMRGKVPGYPHHEITNRKACSVVSSTFILACILSTCVFLAPSLPDVTVSADFPTDDVATDLNSIILSLNPSTRIFTPLTGPPPDISPVPLSRISIAISAYPEAFPLLMSYLSMWRTPFGSELTRPGENEVNYTAYVIPSQASDDDHNLNIGIVNHTHFHLKWALMAAIHFNASSSDIDWFVTMDDDTLPFIDNIARYLARFENPRDKDYFLHGPGERASPNRLGNGGGGFFMSRKILEGSRFQLPTCILGMARRVMNGDIRLDTCLRRYTGNNPQYEPAMFHMDPKVIRGDITGLIEGYMSKVGLLTLHHIKKKKFQLFPRVFLDQLVSDNWIDYQTKLFVKSSRLLGINFLRRFAIALGEGKIGVLNDGYSIVIFHGSVDAVQHYLASVETTFGANPEAIYDELRDLFTEPNPDVERYYLVEATNVNGTITEEFGLKDDVTKRIKVVRTQSEVTLVSLP